MAGIFNVDQIANSAGTGPVSFPFGATGIDIQLGYTTTATAASTTTLTSSSTQLQYFTGSTTQIVVLPVTSGLTLGQQFQVVNLSTGAVTVQSSGANNIFVQTQNTNVIYTCISTSLTTAAAWSISVTTAGINVPGFTSTATAAGTTTLTNQSTSLQTFTGSTTQTVLLPVVSTLTAGTQYTVNNLSSGIVTVQSSGANTVFAQAPNSVFVYTAIAITGTTAASWAYVNQLPYYDAGTFSIAFTMSSNAWQTVTISYTRVGSLVTLEFPSTTSAATANAAIDCANGSIPAALRPARSLTFPVIVENGGSTSTTVLGVVSLTAGGGPTWYANNANLSFTNTTVCGWPTALTISYLTI